MNALDTEIQTDPVGMGYAQHLPDCPGIVVDLLNTPNRSGIKSRFINARTVLSELGLEGVAILDAFEAAASQVSAVKWILPFLSTETGVDVGNPVSRQVIDQLASGGLLTTEQAAKVKALALQPMSRAEQLGLAPVQITDVLRAFGG